MPALCSTPVTESDVLPVPLRYTFLAASTIFSASCNRRGSSSGVAIEWMPRSLAKSTMSLATSGVYAVAVLTP